MTAASDDERSRVLAAVTKRVRALGLDDGYIAMAGREIMHGMGYPTSKDLPAHRVTEAIAHAVQWVPRDCEGF